MEFKKRFRRKWSAHFKSGQWHFHQDNTPVHNSILVTDYLSKMDITTVRHSPCSPDLAPCDFLLFPKLRGCRYETTEEMKEGVKKVIDTLTQEDFHGALQKLFEQERCSRRRLLRRGVEFHVCTVNKSAHRKKKSGNIFNDPRIISVIFLLSDFVQQHQFFIPWFICLSSSLVHFENNPGYHTSVTALWFIPFMRFLLQNLVSSCFPLFLGNSFLSFSFSTSFWIVSAFNIPYHE